MATLVTHPFRSTFIHIPKTGGNSITDWLKKNTQAFVTKRFQHATIQGVINGDHSLGPMTKEDLGMTWCVVRNPWDYCVSWYTFKIMLAEFYIDQIHKNPHMRNNRKEKWNLDAQQATLNRLLSLGFTGWVAQTSKKPQSAWAADCDVKLKLENINNEFRFIQEKMQCFEPLGHANKTLNREKYKDYYTTQESIDIVAKKFHQDIIAFGYDF